MKTIFTPMQSVTKVYLATVLLIMAGLNSAQVMAQNYGRHLKSRQSYGSSSNHFILGVEGGIGTTTYKFTSDIAALKDLEVLAEGWNTDVVFGNNDFRVRGGYGKYQFKKSAEQSIAQSLITGKINFSPAKWFGKSKYFRLYFLTGVDYSIFSFKGVSIPKPKEPKGPAKLKECVCACDLDLGAPPDPGPPGDDLEQDIPEPSTSTNNKSATIKKAQINGGLGLEFNGAKNGRFLRMFAEAYYGIPLKEIINDIGLNNTKISGQMVINLGIGIGISGYQK